MATDGYAKMRAQIASFEQLYQTLGLSFPKKSPMRGYFDLVNEFLADHASSRDAAAAKWKDRDFHEWYKAIIAVEKLVSVASALGGQPAKPLKDHLQLVLTHDISQDFEPSQGKNYLYELEVATWMQKAGFEVELAEPDIRLRGNGLKVDFGLACKLPASEKKLNGRISEGYEQIDRAGIPGIVVVGMDLILCEGMKRFIEIPSDKKEALGVVGNILADWVHKVEKQRAGVAGRKPLDGALFSLQLAGHVREPAGLQVLTQVTFQCTEASPLVEYLAVINQSLNKVCS
jgi:hypothetical protein